MSSCGEHGAARRAEPRAFLGGGCAETGKRTQLHWRLVLAVTAALAGAFGGRRAAPAGGGCGLRYQQRCASAAEAKPSRRPRKGLTCAATATPRGGRAPVASTTAATAARGEGAAAEAPTVSAKGATSAAAATCALATAPATATGAPAPAAAPAAARKATHRRRIGSSAGQGRVLRCAPLFLSAASVAATTQRGRPERVVLAP